MTLYSARSSARRIACAMAVAALAAVPLAPALAKAPVPAPDFVLDSSTGKPVKLSALRGQVVAINFWATWCAPCLQEMPLLDGLYKQHRGEGFTLLGVNVEPDPKKADGWLKQRPVSFPVLYDVNSDVSTLYQVIGMPSTVFIDKKGNIRYVHRGYRPGDEDKYLHNIRELLREQ